MRLEAGRVAVRVPADDHRSPFPTLFRVVFSISFTLVERYGPGSYRRREVSNEHHKPVHDDRPIRRKSVDIFLGACRCLMENERNRQVSQGQKTLE